MGPVLKNEKKSVDLCILIDWRGQEPIGMQKTMH